MQHKMLYYNFNVSKSIIPLPSIKYTLRRKNIILFSVLKLSVQPKGESENRVQE